MANSNDLENKKREQEIESQFRLLGIQPKEYPVYTDPNSFGSSFKKCSILKDVPLVTSGSSLRVR